MIDLSAHKRKEYYNQFRDKKETYLVATDPLISDLAHLARMVNGLQDRTARDHGTCVLGAGIKVWLFKPRKRNPETFKLIAQPFQGNMGSYQALKPCLEHINKTYPELHAFWDDGNMD